MGRFQDAEADVGLDTNRILVRLEVGEHTQRVVRDLANHGHDKQVDLASEGVHELNLRSGLELLKQVLGVLDGVSFEPHRRHDRDGKPKPFGVELRANPGDDAVGLEAPKPALDRRCRQAHKFSKVEERSVGISLKLDEELSIYGIHKTLAPGLNVRNIVASQCKERNPLDRASSTLFWVVLEQILISASVGLANVLGVGMLLPQARLIAKTRSSNGVSGAWIGAGVSINLGWFVYGMSAGVWGLLPVSGGSLVLYFWMLYLLTPVNPAAAREAVQILAGLVGILGVAVTLTGTPGLGFTLSALYTVQFGPAAWAAVRQPDLRGVSTSTWIMAIIEAILWAIYGSAIGDLPVALGGVGASFMSAVILVCLFTKQRRRAVLPGISTSPPDLVSAQNQTD